MNNFTHAYGQGQPERWQDYPNVIARPPWIVAGFLVAGLALDQLMAVPDLFQPVQYLGGAGMLIAAFSLMASAMHALRREHTPVETWQPTRTIVRDGPYGQSRNPVYIAMILGFVGLGVIANVPAIVALSPLLFAALHFGIVKREEHYLECKFGDTYLDYKKTVSRWI